MLQPLPPHDLDCAVIKRLSRRRSTAERRTKTPADTREALPAGKRRCFPALILFGKYTDYIVDIMLGIIFARARLKAEGVIRFLPK